MKSIDFLKENNVEVEKGLEFFGSIEDYNDTMQEFKNGLPEKIAKINEYFNSKDMPNYAILVHSLKSDCKYFGFTKLAEIAYNHEMASKANNVDYVVANYQMLMVETNKVKNIVDSYFEEQQSVATTNGELDNEDIILVADDSEVIRIFVKKVFEGTYKIAVATDGKEALDIIKQHENDNKIKAILLDLNMPNISGFKVLDYMTENNLFVKMPVSVISGDTSKDNIDRAFTYPIVDMLTKPFSEDKVKDIINKTMI